MNRIKEVRELRKIKQSELAKFLQVSQGTLSNWERGVHDPDNETVTRLADYFNVTTDYLLGRANSPNPIDTKKPAQDDINLDELEFALFGELRELDEEDKEELLKDARRMRELQELRKRQKEQK